MCKIFEKKQSDNCIDYSNDIEQVLLYMPLSEYSEPLIRHDVLADILEIDAQQLRVVLMQNYRKDFDLYCLVQDGEYEWRIYRDGKFPLTMDMESFVAITLKNISIVQKLFANRGDGVVMQKLEDIKRSLENYNI